MPETTTLTLKGLQEQRGTLAHRIKELADLSHTESRDFSADEQQEWDRVNADFEKIEADITAKEEESRTAAAKAEERAKRAQRAAELVRSRQGDSRERDTGRQDGGGPEHRQRREGDDGRHERRDTNRLGEHRDFWSLRGTPEYRQAWGPRIDDSYQRAFGEFLRHGYGSPAVQELRALQADLDVTGGFLVASEQFVAQLIQGLDNEVFMRQLGTVFPVMTAESLGVPTLDADPADAVWTGEITAASEDSTMAFGKRTLTPAPLSKLVKVSRALLRKSVLPAERIVVDRLTYKFSVVEENGFLNGTGSNQPLGLFTASAQGISTGRDVSTDNAATDLTADGLINAKYALKGQYHKNANWIFHRLVVRNIRKLKDGSGAYLWQAGIAGDRPSTILEMPYRLSEYAPSTFSASAYVGILGDFTFYWIADALKMEVQRLDELYAATNQVGFIGRKETDGMPVLEEAFVRVQLAAA